MISGAIGGALALPNHTVCGYRGGGRCGIPRVLHGDGAGNQLSLRLDALKSGSVWTGVLLHASHNLLCRPFSTRDAPRPPLPTFGPPEFGEALAIAALVVGIIFYAKRGELQRQRPGRMYIAKLHPALLPPLRPFSHGVDCIACMEGSARHIPGES